MAWSDRLRNYAHQLPLEITEVDLISKAADRNVVAGGRKRAATLRAVMRGSSLAS